MSFPDFVGTTTESKFEISYIVLLAEPGDFS